MALVPSMYRCDNGAATRGVNDFFVLAKVAMGSDNQIEFFSRPLQQKCESERHAWKTSSGCGLVHSNIQVVYDLDYSEYNNDILYYTHVSILHNEI